MAQLINTVQIDSEEDKLERPLHMEDPATLAAMPWRDYLKRADYNTDINKMCELCIAEQKRQHGGRTPIICKGLNSYKERLKEEYGDVLDKLEEALTPEEIDVLDAEFNPVAWWRVHAIDPSKIQTRFYQEMMMQCSAKNVALRQGRRCIAEDELVWMADGTFKEIQNVQVGDLVLSYREGKAAVNKVLDVIDNGHRSDIYKIVLSNGMQVLATSDHELLTSEGWMSIQTGLKFGSKVVNFGKNQIEMSTVVRIIYQKRMSRVWDLTVANDHNFVVGGIVVHNCGKTFGVAMKVMHKIAIAKEPIEILVAAPQITMIDEIVQTLVELSANLDIPGFIKSKKSQPIVHLTFFNGSMLKGITAGSDGTSARGKRADLIWIDEVDFVPAKAIDAIKGVQLDNPDVEMIYTSTPIGQGNLYAFAQMAITKEFHYPTFANPGYTDEMHASVANMEGTRYVQEVLAMYGVDEAGIFPVNMIERSYERFLPDIYNKDFVFNNRQRFIVFIGVDWNHDNNGTRIVAVSYDKAAGKFFVLEKFKISKLNMTQALAVEKVVEVNREYHADHILCDEGFGTAQISQLRLKGEEQYGRVPAGHPDLKLVDTVSVNFGSSLSIIDPVTKETLKRNTKQYIVENTAKALEDGKLVFKDPDDDDLTAQMKNYCIANKGVRGNVYKPRNKKIGDHDLDAYMLCLYGFEVFYSEFIKPQSYDYGAVIGGQGQGFSARDVYDTQVASSFSFKPSGNPRKLGVSRRGAVRRSSRTIL